MKYLVSLLIFFGTFTALAFGRWGTSGEGVEHVVAFTWAEMRAIEEEAERTEAYARALFRFHDRFEDVKRDLRTGRIGLAEAADALQAAALRDHPAFLKRLEENLLHAPLREKIALVLLGHLRNKGSAGATSDKEDRIFDKLSGDLAAWSGVSPNTLEALCEDEAADTAGSR